jgi:phosphate-selective porin
VATTKAFKTVISVTNANATAGTNGLEVGFNDKFGLPLRVTDAAYVVNVKWNATLAADAGTFVAADTTSPATASTTDVRGCFTPSSAANGTKRLVMLIALPALACGPNATRVGAVGVTQA